MRRMANQHRQKIADLLQPVIWMVGAILSRYYLSEESKVVYGSKDVKMEMVFVALKSLAAMTSQVPDKKEQMAQ